MKSIIILIGKFLTLSIFLCSLLASPSLAASPAGYNKYYIPGDEVEMLRVFSQFGAPGSTMHAIITVTAWANNTTVYYDHWEDGYDFDQNDPTTADETVVLVNSGDFHTFESSAIPAAPRGTAQYYDGRDIIYVAGGTTTVSRASWIETVGPVQSIAWEVYPIKPQLTTYILPFGEDLSLAPKNLLDFSRVFAFIQSTSNGTSIQVDLDGDGTPDQLDQNKNGNCNDTGDTDTITINEGEIFLLDRDVLCSGGTLNTGAVITATNTLQVQYIIGSSVHGAYEVRGFSSFPRGFWDDEYYAPVDGSGSADTDIYLHNPHTTILTINYETTTGNGTFTIDPGDTVSFEAKTGRFIPQDSGAYFKGSDVFWGVSSVDTESTTNDWGYSLVPSFLLKDEHFMGWAPSSFPITPGDYNDSGVFITPAQDNTTVFIDLDNDGNPNFTYLLDRLETQYVWDNTDGTLSGAHIWGTGPYAMAYGQNPDIAPPASPAIDVGYTTIPGTDFVDLALRVTKTANPVIISTASGSQSTYTVVIDTYNFTMNNVTATDTLPAGWQYVAGSATITLADKSQLTGSAADPVIVGSVLTWPTTTLGNMAENQQITILFTAQTDGTVTFSLGDITRNVVNVAGTRTVGGVTQTFTTSDSAFNSFGDMAVTKATSGINPLYPGDQFTYSVTVSNPATASAPLTGIAIYDPMPTGVSYVNGTSQVTAPANYYYGDTFENGYASDVDNNPGTLSWATDWFRSNTGDVFITTDLGSNRLRVQDNNRRAMRKADLSGYSAAILNFDARCNSLENNEDTLVEVCDNIAGWATSETCNGTGWVEVTRFAGPCNDGTYSSYSFDLASFLATPNSANFALRFRSTNSSQSNGDAVFFDNIKIALGGSGIVTVPGGNSPNFIMASDGYTLQPGESLTLAFEVLIDDPLALGIESITNTASANSNEITLPLQAQATNIVVNPTSGSAIVGNRVWLDTNANGSQDIGEGGLANSTVVLKDLFGTPVATTFTDSNGYYIFKGIPPGSGYYVEATAGLPAGLNQSAPVGRSDNRTGSFTLVAGQSYSNANLGYTPDAGTATLGNLIWSDANGNGIRDVGETGLTGVTVKLYLDNGDGIFNPATDTLRSTTVSSAGGAYLFTGISASGTEDYFVYVDENQAALSGFTATTGASPLNSNVNSGDVLLNNDFGFQPPAGSSFTIQDNICYDADADGCEAGESGIAGVTVQLLDSSRFVIATTVSDSNGDFFFAGVPGNNNYTVHISDTGALLANYYGTTPSAISGDFAVVNLSANTSGTNFGYNLTSTIGDTVFNDLDGSGSKQPGEPGIGGVIVNLYNDINGNGQIGAGDTIQATLITGLNGSYIFTGLADGDYIVSITSPPAGYTFTGADSDPGSAGHQIASSITSGSANLNIDFGYQATVPRNVSGIIWNDSTPYGVIDLSERGLAGVTVELQLAGIAVGSTTTDTNGNYSFIGIPAAVYTIVLTDTLGILDGFEPTYEKSVGTIGPFNNQETTDLTGGDLSDIHFGFHRPVPTLAVISSFTAFEESGRMVLEWTTASEMGTVGFFLQRLDPLSGSYIPVNNELLPGLLHSPQGGVYRYIDENVAPGQYTYRIVEIEVKGRQREYGPYKVNAGASSSSRTRNIARSENLSTVSVNNTQHHMTLVKNFTMSPHALKAQRTAKTNTTGPELRLIVTTTEPSPVVQLKISTSTRGLHFIPINDIAAGLNLPLNKVQKQIKLGRIQMTNRGHSVTTWQTSSGVYFFAENVDSIYTANNIYWLDMSQKLTIGAKSTEKSAPVNEVPVPVNNQTYIETVHAEKDNWALTALFDNPETDYWLWDYVFAGYGATTFPVATPGLAADGQAEMTIYFNGATESPAIRDHHAIIRVNGNSVGEASWDGATAHSLTISIDQWQLNDGDNTVEITGVLDPGVPYSLFYIDSIDVQYNRLYRADQNSLFCHGDNNPTITIDNFTSPAIHIFDISNPVKPVKVENVYIDEIAGSYRASFTPLSPDTEYLATTYEAATVITGIQQDIPSSLRSRTNTAEYLIISPVELLGPAEQLAKYREQKGFTTKIALLEDIYDEFSNGITTPHAIRDFLQYAYEQWNSAPQYILLAGNGTYDYKDNLRFGDNLIPPVMIATQNGLFASDTYLADVANQDGVPEMAIGRIPASNEAELTVFINKIIDYESAPADTWMRRIILLADDPDDGGNFSANTDQIANLIPPYYLAEKIYLGDHSLADARTLFFDTLNQGALFVNYIGHAGLDRLTTEGLLTTDDVPALTNGDRLPFMAAMTCIAGRFEIPGFTTLGKKLLFMESGGINGLWSATGYSYNTIAVQLESHLISEALRYKKQIVIGNAINHALKQQYTDMNGYDEMLDIYNLLGDPAMILH